MSAHFGWLSIVCLSVCLVCWIYIYLDNPEHIRKLFLHDKANEKKTSERHHREIENYIHVKGMALKAQMEASQARAKLEPEIQCEGCGYFHNLRRCPKCTRTVQKPMSMLYMPPDGGRPTWGASVSASVSETIRTVNRRAVDMNILGMSADAQNNFGRAVTDCNTNEIYYT